VCVESILNHNPKKHKGGGDNSEQQTKRGKIRDEKADEEKISKEEKKSHPNRPNDCQLEGPFCAHSPICTRSSSWSAAYVAVWKLVMVDRTPGNKPPLWFYEVLQHRPKLDSETSIEIENYDLSGNDNVMLRLKTQWVGLGLRVDPQTVIHTVFDRFKAAKKPSESAEEEKMDNTDANVGARSVSILNAEASSGEAFSVSVLNVLSSLRLRSDVLSCPLCIGQLCVLQEKLAIHFSANSGGQRLRSHGCT
jgi:hypothetical protein